MTSALATRLLKQDESSATTPPPSLPYAPGVKFFVRYEAASKELVVGGDWYDAFWLSDGRIGVCIGDVSGHDLCAAVLMTAVKTALRSALTMEPDILLALDAADYLIRTKSTDDFCTALLGIIDVDAKTLRLANAGHPGPKIWDPRSKTVTDPFTDRDLPLGLRDLHATRTEPKTVRMEKGSLAVFYTDGLVEWNRDIDAGC